MVQLPTQEDINAILKRLDAVERENDFLRGLLLDLQWLSVAQVAKACSCSVQTVYRMIAANSINIRYEGKKVMCSLVSVRNYLMGKKIDETELQYRLIGATRRI